MRSFIRCAVMALICLALSVPALAAEDAAPAEAGGPGILDTIQNTLDKGEAAVKGLSIWKFKLGVTFGQRFIYDDNIFLNDEDEEATEGRVWSAISETRLGFDLVLPTNPNYSKFFKSDKIKILGYQFTVQEYFTRSDMDNLAHHFSTDLFSFFKDLFKLEGEGTKFYFQVKNDLEFVTDPLDLEVRDLRLIGFPTVKSVTELERWENRLRAKVGYEGNLIRAHVGYRNEWYKFDDDLFEQADHMEHWYIARVGVALPNLEDKVVYVEGRYRDLDYEENTLNDAEAWEAVVGFEGMVISRKLKAVIEAGYTDFDPSDNGETADDEDYQGAIGLAQIVFRPWEDRVVQFQLEGGRAIGWSAIANYRTEDHVSFTVLYEFIPKKLEADLTLAAEKHDESEGPERVLYELGLGARYKLFTQVTVSARYLYRRQESKDEIKLIEGTTVVAESNGDFFQHVFSIGLELVF